MVGRKDTITDMCDQVKKFVAGAPVMRKLQKDESQNGDNLRVRGL